MCTSRTNRIDPLFVFTGVSFRTILSKGPKYRLPDDIDCNACCEEMHDSLDIFTSKWCKREGTDNSALNNWELAIVYIIAKREKFYSSNPSCLPRKNKFQFKHLKNVVKHIHYNFVLVPADKAASDIIFV